MFKFKTLIKLFLIFLVISLATCYYIYYQNFEKKFTEDFTFVIEAGDSEYTIFNNLAEKNIIANKKLAYYFFRIFRKLNQDAVFTSGEYQAYSDDNLQTLLKKFIDNDIIKYKITIAEGTSSARIVKILNSLENTSGHIDNIPPEGSLFPSTYFYNKNDDKEEILLKMQNEMQEVLAKLWQERDKSIIIDNKIEALVLASIIEKETGLSGERKVISSVFHNRLNINMRLQSDPTVTYGITLGKYELDRPLSKKDLRTATPFNTYVIYGLPLTPITNPGYKAIEASLNPDKTDYLYFVSNGYGEHRFSKNLKQHNIYVRELRKVERQRRIENE